MNFIRVSHQFMMSLMSFIGLGIGNEMETWESPWFLQFIIDQRRRTFAVQKRNGHSSWARDSFVSRPAPTLCDIKKHELWFVNFGTVELWIVDCGIGG
jgi:hypothetical protein